MSERDNGKPVLALDFDGVISDSLLEAYLLTWNLAGRVDPELKNQLKEAPDIDDIREFRDSRRDHWDAFEATVPFGNRAEDYLVIQKAVAQGRRFGEQEEFDEFKGSIPRPMLDEFHEIFYDLRYDLVHNHRERWLKLNDPYPGVRDTVEILAGRFRLAVATSKDGRTVKELLRNWDLFGHFGEKLVLDKHAGENKRAHLTLLRGRFGCRFEDMTFIDDKVSHLIACYGLGVRLCLAGWGYNGGQEHEQARARGFEVLELDDLPDLK